MKKIWLAIFACAGLSLSALAAPIATQLSTGDLVTALDEFDSVAFNGQVRWESGSSNNGYGRHKMLLANGGTYSSPLTTGGGGITWRDDSPQSFSLSFSGGIVTLTVTDGRTPYTIRARPLDTLVNGLMLQISSDRSSTISVRNLKIDNVSLNIGGISLGSTSTSSFLFISGITSPFTLSGQIAMTGPNGNRNDIPAMHLYAGYTAAEDTAGPDASVPEPATFALVGMLLLAFTYMMRKREAKVCEQPLRKNCD
ncbi:MAG: PEP-CTERM sorting domain-containing protein [Bryobacterales bacterium]|nr:PEP-CTERM sorting domain-containing protein [Bryobacterales bacterium]